MFERILSLFQSDTPEPLPELDARLALGALLVRMAKADHAYLFEEIAQIDRILAEHSGLNPVEAAKMRAQCERLEEQLPASADATTVIRNATSEAERAATVEALWRVCLADGISHESEQDLLALVETELGVSPEDGVRLRDAAKARLDLG
ncbi:MAG: hypothetical protein CSA72_04740 [Rhodobacterales bacterium]|nr:MAG: hypothetical protein CSA72_04740 [Rhodobacterales bacterium]